MASCQAPKAVNNGQTEKSQFIKIAENQFGGAAECVKNSSESMVLCINESPSSPQQPRNTVSFMVIKLDDSSTIYESSIDGGSVKWYDDERLEIFNTPGYVKQGQDKEDFTKIYNLSTKEMISKRAFLEK